MNSKGHLYISISKSVIRIAGCIIGVYNIMAIPICFGIAELLGVAEELVDKR